MYRGHFNRWLYDNIVEAAHKLGLQPSFPLPTQLVTRIATSETFGIAPVDADVIPELGMLPAKKEEAGILPRKVLFRLSTRRISDREIISHLQGTLKEVAPVALDAEYILYRKLLESGRFAKKFTGKQDTPRLEKEEAMVNFPAFTLAWNQCVNDRVKKHGLAKTQLAYKLQEHMRRHFGVCVARKFTKETLVASEAQRKPHTDLIKAPTYVARALPAESLIVNNPSHRPIDTTSITASTPTDSPQSATPINPLRASAVTSKGPVQVPCKYTTQVIRILLTYQLL